MSNKLSGEGLTETMQVLDVLHESIKTARNALGNYQNDKVLGEVFKILVVASQRGNDLKLKFPTLLQEDAVKKAAKASE